MKTMKTIEETSAREMRSVTVIFKRPLRRGEFESHDVEVSVVGMRVVRNSVPDPWSEGTLDLKCLCLVTAETWPLWRAAIDLALKRYAEQYGENT